MLRPLFILLSFLMSAPAWANSAADVRAFIASGDYETARVTAETLETAQGYALASEALAAQILLGDVDKINSRAKEARALALQALALDPMLYEAQLQYTLSDGFVTRSANPLTIWRKKLAQKTYARIKNFRTAYPDDARGMALEGAWHLGIIRKTGEKNAEKWFGASLSEGERLYEQARSRTPNDIVIETNYALALFALDAAKFAAKVKILLERVRTMTAQSNLERRVQDVAAKVEAALSEPRRAKKLAEDFLDGK